MFTSKNVRKFEFSENEIIGSSTWQMHRLLGVLVYSEELLISTKLLDGAAQQKI